MRACLRFVVPVLCACSASACLTSDVQITVRPDGSGHVDAVTLVRPAAFAEFERLSAPDLVTRTTPEQLWSEIQKRARDSRVFVRPATPVSRGDSMGLRLSYGFADVTGLVDIDLLPELPGIGAFWSVASLDQGAGPRLRLSLDPIADGLERLTVHFPRFRINPSTEPPAAWASGSAAEMAALKKVMSGARVTIGITTEAPLVRTNSPFREGNHVTLLDVDVAETLFSKQVERMVTTPASFDELLAWLGTVPGVSLAPVLDVTLDFQNPSTEPRAAPSPGPASSDTEIFVASLIGSGKTLAVGPPLNISNSPGYDNQPAFSRDGKAVFFVSDRAAMPPGRDTPAQAPAALPRTDVYRYELPERNLWRITATAESEFSPTVMPDGTHLSMVRVEADGTQRLCTVEPGNVPRRETSALLPNIKPVGYHAWIDSRSVALFILGSSGAPSTLHVASLDEGTSKVVATDIGRSLQRTPAGSISFVQRETTSAGPAATIAELDVKTMTTRSLVKPAAAITDPFVAWLPDGTALMAAGSTLYRWHDGDAGWSVVAHLDGFGLHNVTRLAASPSGDRLALVAQK